MITVHLAQHAADTTSLLAGSGLLDVANEKAAAIQATLRVLAGVGSIFWIIKIAARTSMAIAPVLIAALSAGAFMWVVFNITDLQDRVDNEVNGAGLSRPTVVLEHHAARLAQGTPLPGTSPQGLALHAA